MEKHIAAGLKIERGNIMHKLKKLQEQYRKGEIDKAAYLAAVKLLLTDDYIDQEESDEAAGFNPEEGKAIYTQADVDSFIAKKAVSMARKALKDSGVEVEGANKDFLGNLAALVKVGQATGGEKATDKDLEKLRAWEAKGPALEARVKDLVISNAVIGAAGKYNPYNAAQVVRALKLDYMNLIDVDDETGDIDAKSIDRVLRRIKEAEPNLFKATEDADDEDNEGAGDDDITGAAFKGKGPKGGGEGGGKDKDFAAKKAAGLAMLNIKINKE